MQTTVMFEVFVDLVLEDVLNDGCLFEANPYHDAAGKFTSKDAAKAYGSGAMAKGRAAGMKAKAQGLGREQIRASIKDAMQKHIEAGGSRAEGQGRLGLIRGKIAKGTLPGQVQGGAVTDRNALAKKELNDPTLTTKRPTGLPGQAPVDKKLDRTLEKGKRIVDRERAVATARAAGIVGDMQRAGYKEVHSNGKGTTFYQHPETKDTVMVSRYIEKGWMADPDKHGVLIKRVDQSVMGAEKARNAGAADRNALARKELNDQTLSATRGMEKSFEPGDERHPAVKAAVDAVRQAAKEGGVEAGQQEFIRQAMGLLGAVPRRRR